MESVLLEFTTIYIYYKFRINKFMLAKRIQVLLTTLVIHMIYNAIFYC